MNRRRFRLFSGALSVLAGVTVFLVAFELFPYHTTNHDEGVYLQQAAMLLEGQLSVWPPVPEAFRPWFFVRDGARLYPKYAPVPAAMFAVGKVLGEFRLALALVAAGNVALLSAVVTEAFDRRTGIVAAVLFAASPLFLINSAAFLPYAPTTFWNLLFAFAYLRAAKTQSRRYAALAGIAVGVAFFSRPYTAVLFAAPFIAHALYSLVREFSRERLTRLSVTAAFGLLGVVAALAYNAAVTGSPFTFPYEAFAPQDGLGFGHREILGYSRNYTPELALRANAEVVSLFFTEWVVGGPLGTLLAAVGLGVFLRREWVGEVDFRGAWRSLRIPRGLVDASNFEFTETQARAILAGLFLSIVAGNVYFWGNLNVLGSLADPNDGLVDTLGPYYHFDLLVPTAVFAAHGALATTDRLSTALSRRSIRPRTATLAIASLGVLLLATSTGAVLAPTVQENAAITDEYEAAYQPFEQRDLSNSVVFLPTPYGDWLNHPFQHLRNGPDFDGETVYALDDGGDSLAVAEAYPNRTYYRYVYRGQWAPYSGEPVEPALQRVHVARGDALALRTTVGVPAHADRVSARVSTESGTAYYAVNGTPANLSTRIVVENGTARLAGSAVLPVGGNATVPVAREDEVVVQLFVSDATGGGFTYRLELPVRRANGTVSALSPYREVCFDPVTCNGEAAYVKGSVPDDVRMETILRAVRNETAS
ncbi:ArnT family glycosyltransferase [Halorussus halophilus]|uniref:ArnT family glycosyltransferase n=1 Tax=Halorussus halophilus TaxID=2650975 RepID=UPI001300DBBB|nr:glycosyltransferase family 39 protein [Halorussus halophilus]